MLVSLVVVSLYTMGQSISMSLTQLRPKALTGRHRLWYGRTVPGNDSKLFLRQAFSFKGAEIYIVTVTAVGYYF